MTKSNWLQRRVRTSAFNSVTCGLVTSLVVLSASTSAAQNMPPELNRSKSRSIDPSLPDAIRSAVERASAAELDKKRGTGNALQILRAERPKWKDVPAILIGLELRIAAIVLRSRFLQNKKATKPVRYQQALSTYSKLELTDPGLLQWLKRTLKHYPEVKKKLFGRKKYSEVPVAVLTRGSGLNGKTIFNKMQPLFKKAGIRLKKAKVKNARYLFKFGSDEVRNRSNGTVVRVTLSVESRVDGKMVWQQSFYRSSQAAKLSDAIADNVGWLVKVGGRDMLFNWIRYNGLQEAFFSLGGGGGHDGHNHGHHGHNHGGHSPGKGKHQREPPPPDLHKSHKHKHKH